MNIFKNKLVLAILVLAVTTAAGYFFGLNLANTPDAQNTQQASKFKAIEMKEKDRVETCVLSETGLPAGVGDCGDKEASKTQDPEPVVSEVKSSTDDIGNFNNEITIVADLLETCGYTFSEDLKKGDWGVNVKNLQIVLNSDADTAVAKSGAGSKEWETSYFGPLTKAAVIKFQNKYASEILTPFGIKSGTGLVNAPTRDKLNALKGVCASLIGKKATNKAGTATGVNIGITISSAVQPEVSQAVANSTRVPYTKIVLTASSETSVQVDSIIVERIGFGNDAAFAGIILLDENGQQLGASKTLNSVHKAVVGAPFIIPAGKSKVLTIAANISNLDSYAGNAPYLSVVGINTSAEVGGKMPITGVAHTFNDEIFIGSLDVSRGPLDPNKNKTTEPVTEDYTFTSIRLTAGSTENIKVQSVRWVMSGSATSSNLFSAAVYANEKLYALEISPDGKYYTANFGSGVVVTKDGFVDVSVKGDIFSGSGETIDFDIYQNTDIYATGMETGYGITPTIGENADRDDSINDSEFNISGTPWYDGAQTIVGRGSITITKADLSLPQNIATTSASQILGAIKVNVVGEPISVQKIVFGVATTTGVWNGPLTNIVLVDEDGVIVSEPVDTTGEGTSIIFTGDIIFPTGEYTYIIKGDLPPTAPENATYQLATVPSENWTGVTGENTGEVISPSPAVAQPLQIMIIAPVAENGALE